jgi:cytoskeletal protein CcmA (bactofilin family)
MANNSTNDLRINGIGSSSGGKYDFVQINGKGDITGDLECRELQINGLAHLDGNVKADTIRVSGKSDFRGNISGQRMIIDGMTDVGGTIKVETVENRGMLRIAKDCGSEVFSSQGGFTVGGLLNAGKIDISVYAQCKAKEIGGETIDVRIGGGIGLRKFIGSLFPGLPLNPVLLADSIEGDDVYLENTTAKVVRGQNVKIGPGCQIGVVEFAESFHKDPAAGTSVNESRKI